MTTKFGAYNPIAARNFRMSWGDTVINNLTSVSGLNMEVEHTEYKGISEDGKPVQGKTVTLQKMPGEFTVKRLAVPKPKDDALWKWLVACRSGFTTDPTNNRKSVSVTVLTSDGLTPLVTFNFVNAFPSKGEYGELSISGTEILDETWTFQYDYSELQL